MPVRRSLRHPLVWLLALCAAVRGAAAQSLEATMATQDLKGLTIEQLMTIDVTSANRREEPVGSAAAAVSVITGDDLRRSGVTTIADALRLADGVSVARFNNGTWAITPRGFNQNTANKVLVMVDGRTEYSPLFTGVFWNTLDYVLEDIERIEVIRGPGAVLWGANAVNGVVNIITRSARDTRGGYASVAGGNEDRGIAEFRYGAAFAGGPAWRAYGKFAARDAQRTANGASSHDAIQRGQAGVRVDGGSASSRNWMLKADLFHSDDKFLDRAAGEFTNGALQARYSAPVGTASRLTVQSYYRREYRRVPAQLTHQVDTWDVDAQHAWTPRRHDIVWGGGFRVNADQSHSGTIMFTPADRTYTVSNVFAQDEVALLPDRLYATLGAKWEHNVFSGGEFQPNVRARVQLSARQMAWGAVSRAVRRPTRFEDDILLLTPSGTPFIRGNDDFEAESLLAFEAGYRVQPGRMVSIDVAGFRHRIANLRSQDAAPGGLLPLTIGNTLIGHAHGLEAAANIQPLPRWRTHVSYTWTHTDVDRAPGSRDVSGGVNEANDPVHQFAVRSSLDLPRDVQLDAMLRSVSRLPHPIVPAYSELSLRIGWTPIRGAEVWFAGQDLLQAQHPEFGAPVPTRIEFERSVRVGIAFRF